jgi:gamma-glutamyl:cysteine ligase YbdK (ATP-grasp superfamily)
MGQEIATSRFSAADFDAFAERLREETELLASWFANDGLAAGPVTAGFELEIWLVDARRAPAPVIDPLLRRLDDPLVVPELATFNAEINCRPRPLTGTVLTDLAKDLTDVWQRCARAAATLGAETAMIGILPTVRPDDLVLDHMTPRERYRALNERILALRAGRPLVLAIDGDEPLRIERTDVMLEAAATSFQLHVKVPPRLAARAYNLSKILSAPMVAITANSPFLFGHRLWPETRIPLFEQAVAVGGSILGERVNFGFRYAKRSIMETFLANLSRYPILLPELADAPPEQLAHLRLHNGTIWRWNRPLIGFDDDGRPHIRIEHRVIPAGPTIADAIANAALYYGALQALLDEPEPIERALAFPHARANFYAAARQGLDTKIHWLHGRPEPILEVLREDLLPRAHAGLATLGIPEPERDQWLAIIAGRIANRQTGAAWQQAWVARHGPDMAGLLDAYLARQTRGAPVHEWSIEP